MVSSENQRDARDHAAPPTEPVGERPDQHGTDADADQPDRRRRGERGVGEAEVAALGERGDHRADDDEVEPVEGDGDPAQRDRPEASAAERRGPHRRMEVVVVMSPAPCPRRPPRGCSPHGCPVLRIATTSASGQWNVRRFSSPVSYCRGARRSLPALPVASSRPLQPVRSGHMSLAQRLSVPVPHPRTPMRRRRPCLRTVLRRVGSEPHGRLRDPGGPVLHQLPAVRGVAGDHRGPVLVLRRDRVPGLTGRRTSGLLVLTAIVLTGRP